MAYNNIGGGSSGGGQGHPQGQRQDRQRPAEILPEKVPANYVDQAEAVMREASKRSEKDRITTSKIRNLLSLVSDIYNAEKLRTETELLPDDVSKVGMMRVRTAYEAGRESTVKRFVKEAKLLQYLKGIGDNREEFIRFAHYMEALVAYHRYYGGKD